MHYTSVIVFGRLSMMDFLRPRSHVARPVFSKTETFFSEYGDCPHVTETDGGFQMCSPG